MRETRLPHSRSAHAPRCCWRWPKLLILVAGCVGFAMIILFNSHASALPIEPQDGFLRIGFDAPESSEDFTRFTHTNETHAQLPCLFCHRREDNSTRPGLPGHTSCAGCHSQRFADAASPICTICHTNVETGAVKSFPNLKSFSVKFDHARHLTGASRTAATCATCHRPERRGVALSIPEGLSAHATCYQCHTTRAQSATGDDISSCSTCHSLGRYTRTPEWTRAYRVNFSHAKHGSQQELSCVDCHRVRAGMAQARQVTAPVPTEHHGSSLRAQTCMACHNNKRAFGGDDFSDCKRCHQGSSWHFNT